jgi:peptidoglycan-associated lipoprotein
MRRIFDIPGVVFVASAALLLTGCPKPYPNCDSDEACKERGEVCVQGQCQECASDANCKEGFVCQGNKCVPKTPESGVGKPCQTNADCDSGKCLNNRCAAADACVTNEDCPGGQECTEGTCTAKTAARCNFDPVQFGFNEYSLTPEVRGQLAAIADCVKSQGLNVTLEGHADERGTEEYNLQLSNKRAAAVKKYLVDLGVAGKQLDTVGYGENRPAQSGSSEAAWTANRRVEFSRK